MTSKEIKDKIIDIVDRYWKFDEHQQPQSSWHDKQDCLKELKSQLAEAGESKPKVRYCYDCFYHNRTWDDDPCVNCFGGEHWQPR